MNILMRALAWVIITVGLIMGLVIYTVFEDDV
jgi:hypothetical protein